MLFSNSEKNGTYGGKERGGDRLIICLFTRIMKFNYRKPRPKMGVITVLVVYWFFASFLIFKYQSINYDNTNFFINYIFDLFFIYIIFVFLHEIGHILVAKMKGYRTEFFSVGPLQFNLVTKKIGIKFDLRTFIRVGIKIDFLSKISNEDDYRVFKEDLDIILIGGLFSNILGIFLGILTLFISPYYAFLIVAINLSVIIDLFNVGEDIERIFSFRKYDQKYIYIVNDVSDYTELSGEIKKLIANDLEVELRDNNYNIETIKTTLFLFPNNEQDKKYIKLTDFINWLENNNVTMSEDKGTDFRIMNHLINVEFDQMMLKGRNKRSGIFKTKNNNRNDLKNNIKANIIFSCFVAILLGIIDSFYPLSTSGFIVIGIFTGILFNLFR